jgi:inner membrane protein
MCTFLTHGFVAIAAGKAAFARRMPARFWAAALFCSIVPDADVVLHTFGVRYGDVFGHRGFSHSLLFAALLSLLVMVTVFRSEKAFSGRWWKLLAFFFLLTASHGVLDAFTDGGRGIAFLSPFDTTRYFWPWTPIAVPYIGLRAQLQPYTLEVLLSEFVFVWLPVTALWGVVMGVRQLRRA